jgi:probable rRNA maturation factor
LISNKGNEVARKLLKRVHMDKKRVHAIAYRYKRDYFENFYCCFSSKGRVFNMNSVLITDEIEGTTEAELELIKNVITKTLEHEKYDKHYEVSVLITNDEHVRELNKTYREMDKPTDVLSFPMADEGACLGDIVLSLERARAQAAEYGHSEAREIAFLIAHSTLHLLGYDHEEGASEGEMFDKQEEILDLMGISR